MASCLDLSGARNGSCCPSSTSPPTATCGWRSRARRRGRVARSRPTASPSPLEAYRRRDRRGHRAGDGEPGAVPLERADGRQGDLPMARERRRVVVRRRLPRRRDRPGGRARPRLRLLLGRGAEVAVRRAGPDVPLRAAGPAADAASRWSRGGSRRAEPFSFDLEHLEYHPTARRLEHGTPPAPVVFLAQGGLDIITEVGAERDPRAAGRAHRLRDRRRRRGGAAGPDAARPAARGGVVNVGVGPGRREDLPRAARHATSARTSAATGCASARTSSTPRTTSTGCSGSSAHSSEPD